MCGAEFGRISIEYPVPLIAGELVTVVFNYTVGEKGLAEKGRLRIGLPNVGWHPPEVPQHYFWSEYAKGKDREYTQYDRVNTTVCIKTNSKAFGFLESEARFRKPWIFPPSWLRDYDRYWLTVTAEDDGLVPGDKIIVTYGDPAQAPATARVQAFPEKKLCFLAFVDICGDGQFQEVPGSPHFISVRAGTAQRMDVISPSIVIPGQTPGTIKVVYTDHVKARPQPTPLVGQLKLELDGTDTVPRQVIVDKEVDSILLPVPELIVSGQTQKPVRISVCDPQRNVEARGNPTLVRTHGMRLFWGDLHGQSQYHGWNPVERIGISCNTPEECYRYARDIAGLDFCAITDSAGIAKEGWRETVETALRMNEPGRFVTFQGAEVGDNRHGHRNLIFAGNDPEPGIVGDKVGMRADMLAELETPNIQKRYAGREDVILIPHHTKMWLDWDCYEPTLEPVLEIYSIWGSGERQGTDLWDLREMTGGAQEAWTRGYKVGVVAGSDTHAGLPGRSLPCSDRDDFLRYPAGLAAVWTLELTRKGIFEALRAGRCYGTTGVRIILETFISDYPMGSEVAWMNMSTPRQFRVNVWGTDELEAVVVIKNREDAYTIRPKSDHVEFAWNDSTRGRKGDYYYVRVIQRDGNRAWSSPIWLA